ncbi:disease resistance protein RUN1-like isoform X2 [Carya illinoinensis]|uniref:disease resistance protein RUN1-like isoform X2 n=1 Tax=Carya illinoinensis TaxID=32201 RepID=UPI001C719CBD|nr:disease resistance protein RUN1-like isoform X2 [Carya illinoinensis]
MAFSSPSSSSSPPSTHKWHVFLSFRGDTRNNFTAHLYPALCQRGIKTYRDDKDLEGGEPISPTLLKAIEESMSSIIILSPDYASSTWCLEELTKILECKKTKQQFVLPVFYHVDPSEVRKQEGSFGKALAKHQERFNKDPKVQRWKEALQEVGSLAGKHLEDGNEYEFMHKIIQWVDSKIVKSTYKLDIAEYPIGLESHLKDLNTKLRIGRNDITLVIGIYGIGGVGKTTIAKAFFNSIGNQFEARCFLENVREISCQVNGLVKLQEKLLRKLLGNSGSFDIGSVGGTNDIKDRLCSKKILLILDDVNELSQLQGLAGDKNWFGPGSRIVITTRDQRPLTCHNQVDSTYEVQGLDDNQAIQLFSCHAFKSDRPVESYVELTKRIIDYAKGLPLALTVLGSALYNRNIEQWKSELEKYEISPHKDIYEILKISYDGLDDNEKDIFLDIACFFKGKSVEYVMKILDSCRFSSSSGIPKLQEKCLININHDDHCVEMHDLLQEMGKEIVRQESPKKAGKRSRLWLHEDVRRVLEANTATDKIEAMLLDFPVGHDKIDLHPDAFGKMSNLRLFINENAQFSTGPNYLSNQIRLLYWPHYPSSSLPSNFRGDNLVEFQMSHSLVKELDGLKFKNLTDMQLWRCEFITRIPDLSSSPNLKNLDLEECSNLVEVHDSVGLLDKLEYFNVEGCCKLRILPKRFKLRSLSNFDFAHCLSLEDFPEIECEMEFLRSLLLFGTSIKELPSSIKNLKGLQFFHVEGFIYQLGSVPIFNDAGSSSSSIWKSLQHLYLKYCCLSESNFFTYVNYFPALEKLDLSGSDIVIFPPHQGVRFPKLRYLCLNNCKELKEVFLPLPSSIRDVRIGRVCSIFEVSIVEVDGYSQPIINIGKVEKENGIQSTSSIVSTGEYEIASTTPTNSSIFNDAGSSSSSIWESLEYLYLQYCCLSESNFFTYVNYFPALESLDLSGSDIVIFPPHQGVRFPKLKHLYLNECKELKEVFLPLPSSIRSVSIRRVCSIVKGSIVEVDGYSQPIINIGKVEEEDGIQSTSSIVSTGEYEIASTTPTNSSIFNDAGSSSSAIWKSLQELYLEYCCLSESNFFTYVNYFPALEKLDLSGSDIVIFPPHQYCIFPKLRDLCLNNCKELKEVFLPLTLPLTLPRPPSVRSKISFCRVCRVCARGCTSLERFALPSKMLTNNNGRDFSINLDIDLYGCHKLLVIPSWEEGFQSLAYPALDPRSGISIILPGMKIPSWFSYRMEARDSNLCEIDINPPHHWNGIDEILVISVVFGFRSVGINEPRMEMDSTIDVQILDGSDWRNLQRRIFMGFHRTDFSDHLWMQGILYYRKQVDVSRIRFKCQSKVVVFKSVGIHFQKMHEENYSSSEEASSDEKGDRCLDLMDEKRPDSSTMGITITELENEDEYPKEDMDLELKLGYPFSELENDDENPNEDLELEKDDENPKEILGKRHRDDEYDCNMEPNRCPQQKRPHIYSSTMGTITEVENDLNLDLELKLGLV